jgi:hypothetical protein
MRRKEERKITWNEWMIRANEWKIRI